MSFKNLVFSGGGVLGIAYIGLLHSLYEHHIIEDIQRVAGTSAGAITACLTSFNLSFDELKSLADSLDYTNIPLKDASDGEKIFSNSVKEPDRFFDNFDCVYRFLKHYGWYSSNYFYNWIKAQIANQFNPLLKLPPYTFADFKDTQLHKDERPFKDLYMIGTDITNGSYSIFSYETTPTMEVAEAVRISMSIPLFFECIQSSSAAASPKTSSHIYSDGGLLYTYPINLFDKEDPLEATLGCLVKSDSRPKSINNIIDFISSIIICATSLQYKIYQDDPSATSRTIEINTGQISTMDFNIKPRDSTYNYLYNQGYTTTEIFSSKFIIL
ncbi:patatin-like phospholipase family protein [Cellulosilyticum ruminicola]|uniref:patatin-like phospholipase family protein n=1 Tax=Cellulosilyticum ruminicola TaxID=425254 RepID=UPI0006CF9133|nr:patatin-like phospholipase family protein [Cellulosilyticum ruminicola]